MLRENPRNRIKDLLEVQRPREKLIKYEKQGFDF